MQLSNYETDNLGGLSKTMKVKKNVFAACLKKEYIELRRTKTFYSILGLALGVAVLSIIYVLSMTFFKEYISVDGLDEIALFFEKNYRSSTGYFMAFMITYFFLVIVIVYSNSISKQINNKLWLLPINSGILPGYMIGAKIIVASAGVCVCYMLSCALHFVLTILLTDSGGLAASFMIFSYLSYLVYLLFTVVMTISLNAITKKRWVPILTMLVLSILFSQLLSAIVIAGTNLVYYTPLAFYSLATQFMTGTVTLTWLQWVSASLTTVFLAGGFLIWAFNSNKIKAQKSSVLSE